MRSQASARCRCDGRLARHQLGRQTQLGHGSLGLPQRQQARSGEQVRRPEGRIETGGGAELDERIGVPSALLQHDAEVVSNEGSVTAVPDHGAKRRLGRVELTGRQRGDAFGEPRRPAPGDEILLRERGRRAKARPPEHSVRHEAVPSASTDAGAAARSRALELDPRGQLHRARLGHRSVPFAEIRARQIVVEGQPAPLAGVGEHVPVPQVEDLEPDLQVRVCRPSWCS